MVSSLLIVPDELQLHSVGLELNGDRTIRSADSRALNHRIGKFAAGQKVRGLTVDGHQVRFRQNLQHLLLLQVFDGRSQVDIGSKQENVQQVRQVELRESSSLLRRALVRREGAKLLSSIRCRWCWWRRC